MPKNLNPPPIPKRRQSPHEIQATDDVPTALYWQEVGGLCEF
jgi:hypothetical protein